MNKIRQSAVCYLSEVILDNLNFLHFGIVNRGQKRLLETMGSGGSDFTQTNSQSQPSGKLQGTKFAKGCSSLCHWEPKDLWETSDSGFYLFLVLAFLQAVHRAREYLQEAEGKVFFEQVKFLNVHIHFLRVSIVMIKYYDLEFWGGRVYFSSQHSGLTLSVIKVQAENADRNLESGTEAEDGVQGMFAQPALLYIPH